MKTDAGLRQRNEVVINIALVGYWGDVVCVVIYLDIKDHF
jgi:hypothetical protein